MPVDLLDYAILVVLTFVASRLIHWMCSGPEMPEELWESFEAEPDWSEILDKLTITDKQTGETVWPPKSGASEE